MGQLNVQTLASVEGMQKLDGALEHGIAGGLGGQRDVQAAMRIGPLQPQMGQKSEFGLALAHGRFNQHQCRTFRPLQQGVPSKLQRTCLVHVFAVHYPGDGVIGTQFVLQQRSVRPPANGGQGLFCQLSGRQKMLLQ